MAQCPNCKVQVGDGFGMVTCQSCNSILFIDMEGQAYLNTASGNQKAEPTRLFHEVPEVIELGMAAGAEPSQIVRSHSAIRAAPAQDYDDEAVPNLGIVEEPGSEPRDANPFASTTDSSSASDFSSAMNFGEQDHFAANPSHSSPIAHSENTNSGQSGYLILDAPAPVEEAHSLQIESPIDSDPVNISSYADSEISQGRDGPLLFRLKISGIDSKELRESIRAAISDTRFAWNVAEIMSGISMGDLTIDQISPIKTSILVNRLKRLPVQIKWEQYAITQVEPHPG